MNYADAYTRQEVRQSDQRPEAAEIFKARQDSQIKKYLNFSQTLRIGFGLFSNPAGREFVRIIINLVFAIFTEWCLCPEKPT